MKIQTSLLSRYNYWKLSQVCKNGVRLIIINIQISDEFTGKTNTNTNTNTNNDSHCKLLKDTESEVTV